MILLVEDNRELSEALTEFLSRQGHAVGCATNGSDALRFITDSQTRPTVILLDLVMPVLDGWGFLAERSKDRRLAEVPVVIVSGCRDITLRAIEAGAAAVLRKPVEPQTLLRVIEHFDRVWPDREQD